MVGQGHLKDDAAGRSSRILVRSLSQVSGFSTMRPNQPIPGDGNANLFTCFRVQSDSISSGSAPWLLLLVKAFVQKKKVYKAQASAFPEASVV